MLLIGNIIYPTKELYTEFITTALNQKSTLDLI